MNHEAVIRGTLGDSILALPVYRDYLSAYRKRGEELRARYGDPDL